MSDDKSLQHAKDTWKEEERKNRKEKKEFTRGIQVNF